MAKNKILSPETIHFGARKIMYKKSLFFCGNAQERTSDRVENNGRPPDRPSRLHLMATF
jgi:hypothetical protein